MTPTDQPALAVDRMAGHRLSMAAAAAERGEQKPAETSSLLSIAASLLHQLPLISAALTEIARGITVPPPFDPVEIPGELVASSCCCQGDRPKPADRVMNLLEFAFGIIANVDEKAGTHKTPQWREAKREFVADYNRLLADMYSPSPIALVEQARDEVARLREELAGDSAEALAAELDERSAD